MRKKKIAVVLSTDTKDGGGHQYAMLLMECLAKRQKVFEVVAICGSRFWKNWCREHEICCLKEKILEPTEEQMEFNRRFPYLAQLYNTFLTPMGKELKEEKVDILLAVEQIKFMPHYMVKMVMPVHDLMHRYESKFPEVQSDFKRREMILKTMVKYADCILTDSELGRRQFMESYMKRKAMKPYVASLPFIAPEHIYNKEEATVEVPDKFLFYPAQFWKHKNHINLIRAVELLKNSINDIHLILVGAEKNCLKSIIKYIEEHGLGENVTILGFLCDENITYLYTHAVAMVMPSYFGPTNIPPLEAMVLGCPVVVSNKYAMPEQVGDAGMCFDPDSPEEIAQCIKKLWLDEKLRAEMRRKGYEIVSKWGKKEFRAKLLKILYET